MSFYQIGVSYWAALTLGLLLMALCAALLRRTSREMRNALNEQVERLRESYEHISAAFHEPLPSSPSHQSYPPQL